MSGKKAERVYIAGPMSGRADFNFPAFNEAAAALRAAGFVAINPAEGVKDTTKPWEFYMRRAVRLLLTCDRVATLPGWQGSKGASFEVSTAELVGMRVLTLQATLAERACPCPKLPEGITLAEVLGLLSAMHSCAVAWEDARAGAGFAQDERRAAEVLKATRHIR